MRLTIDGHDVPLATAGPREPNFGEPAPGWKALPYALEVPTATFVAAVEPFYEECAEVDQRHGAADAPLDVLALRGLGWPPLARLVAAPPPLFEQFLKRVGYDILLALSWEPAEAPAEWLLDSVDTVRIRAGVVRIRGRVLGPV